jgi:hypothetical protein
LPQKSAGKITLLHHQMTSVIGNMPGAALVETYGSELRTPDPLSCFSSTGDTFEDPVPQTLEDWATAQAEDPDMAAFIATTPNAAVRGRFYILADPEGPPKILVPSSIREALVRSTHKAKFHLGAAKITASLRPSCCWPTITTDVRGWLANCPDCELEKARQSAAHGLFSARPRRHDAPRSRWAMDFQGQGLALTGETQALALVDASARYVEVLHLKDREAASFVPPFLDRIVFRRGPPDVSHSDAAPEFLSENLRILAETLRTSTTTTMGHNAKANATVDIFWRHWSRCMRILPDDQYNGGRNLLRALRMLHACV